jgi:hypothetical protein
MVFLFRLLVVLCYQSIIYSSVPKSEINVGSSYCPSRHFPSKYNSNNSEPFGGGRNCISLNTVRTVFGLYLTAVSCMNCHVTKHVDNTVSKKHTDFIFRAKYFCYL